MNKNLICILYMFLIVSVFRDWRFNDMPMKYKKQVKLICLEGYYAWKFPGIFFSIPVFDTKERLVKCGCKK